MITKINLPDLKKYNSAVESAFLAHKDDPETLATHHFENRFENIYIPREKIPGLSCIFRKVLELSAEITKNVLPSLQMDYWFNYMKPGDRTLVHNHDENDELLSGVYYVAVPENSGVLYLGDEPDQEIVEPVDSLLVFFPPYLNHSVGINESSQHRLSIGINIGKRRNSCMTLDT